MIRAWRGLQRGRLNAALKYLQALQSWNAKNPTAGLFSAGDLVTVAQTEAILIVKLEATRPR
jgi:hypothetical protein